MQKLKVDESGHRLVTEDDKPFFWLGDTAWRLIAKLDREEVLTYFEDRKKKCFNVIQLQMLPLSIKDANAYGYVAFDDGDVDEPNEGYWAHVDFVFDQARSMGFYVALLPAWASAHVETKRNKEPFVNSPEIGYRYGLFVGNRYKTFENIIWFLGGDARPTRHEIYDELARGIKEGTVGGEAETVLMSYHPPGGTFRPPATSSGEFYHDKSWMDFNMIQSGHQIGNKNYERISEDYKRIPPKPTFDSEPCYEHHPVKHDFENGEFYAHHVRRRAYWSVLAGAFGFTYGGNGVWQMDKPGHTGRSSHHNYFWYDALNHEGAHQMRFVRALFESRPSWIPDQSIVVSDEGSVDDRIQSARAEDGSYWIVYVTNGRTIELDLSKFEGSSIHAWWYSPRDGLIYTCDMKETKEPLAISPNQDVQSFDPPGIVGEGNDWVLVLDEASKGYGLPGLRSMCLDNSVVEEHAESFLSEMATRYKNYEGLYGYDVLNKYTLHKTQYRCYCAGTRDRFVAWLKQKYESLDDYDLIYVPYPVALCDTRIRQFLLSHNSHLSE